MAVLRLRVLGGFGLVADVEASDAAAGVSQGAALPKKAQALLAYLALREGRSVTRSQLAGLLWGDTDEQRARHSLSQVLSAIRRALEDSEPGALELTGDGVRLDTSGFEIDAIQLASDATDGVALYGGELLAGFNLNEPGFDAWLTVERTRLREIALLATAGRLDQQTDAGETDAAMATAHRLLSIDPLAEGAHRALMSLYAGRGDTHAALRQFQNLEKLLQKELGTEPDADTRRLYQTISHGRTRENGNGKPTAPPSPAATPQSTNFRHAVIAAGLVIAAAVMTVWQPWVPSVEPASVARMKHPLPDKPSIAVLPFSDFSETKDQGYFADGLTQEITSNLASFENIFVIARNSTSKFKGKSVDVRIVAEDLGVRYVLGGSIRRAGDDIRVTAQLIDAITGRHIWAGRYDRELKDIFALQDEITAEIVGRLVSKVAVAEFEKRSRRQTRSLEAYALFLQGWKVYNQLNPKNNQRAIRFFKQAIAKDPEYGRAYAMLGFARRHNAANGWGEGPDDTLEKALELTKKGVALSPEDPKTQLYLAALIRQFGRFKEALPVYEKAIANGPGDATVLAGYATALAMVGRAEDAVRSLETAFRIDPHARYPVHYLAGIAYYHLKYYEKSAKAFERAHAINPRGRSPVMAIRAAAHAQLGNMGESHAAREEFLEKIPKFSIQGFIARTYYRGEYRRRVQEGLRKAGYPELPPLKLPDQPSIAVLPFANMPGDKDQEYFADGLTEDVITDLSKLSGLLVIARSATLKYKGKLADIRQVSRALGVRYVLQGSVRKADGRVRVAAQLVDGADGHQIWAQSYDRDLKDIFAVQDDLSENVVAKLAVVLKSGERDRMLRRHTNNVDAAELYHKGLTVMLPPNPKSIRAARPIFEKTIDLDPKYAGGYAGLAWTHILSAAFGLSKPPGEALNKALQLANKAIALDPTMSKPWTALGGANIALRRHDEAIAAFAKAVQVEPGYALGHMLYGDVLGLVRRYEDAKKAIKELYRRAPTHVSPHLGYIYRASGEFEKAIQHLEDTTRPTRRFNPRAFVQLAAAYMQAGRGDDARRTVREVLERVPKMSLQVARGAFAYKYADDMDRLLAALRAAGLPEGAPPKPKAPTLSIAVLPFANLSDDKSQGYFADAITGDLITDLSRIRGAFVIARGTSFTYKGRAVGAKDVARELRVRYVLEGSVRRTGDQVRVNAQMIDGASGAQIWSDKFDRSVADIYSLQNEVTRRIASALKYELVAAESRRLQAGPPANLDAQDYALRGWAEQWTKPASKETALAAKGLFEKALQLDPNSALAWTGMAAIYLTAATSRYGITKTRGEAHRLLLQAGQRAVALDPKSSDAFHRLSSGLRFYRQSDKAISACKTAIELNPNDDFAHQCLGVSLNNAGRYAEALPAMEAAVRLNPRTPRKATRNFHLGRTHLGMGNYEAAVAVASEGITLNPMFPPQYWVLASALGWLGRKEEARSVWADFVRIDKGRRGTIAKIAKRYSYMQKFDHVLEGLRRAGVPEK